MSAPGAALFDDAAAVEATVAQKGSAASSTAYDGVGLILRVAADGQDFIVFYVNQDGFWSLARYQHAHGDDDSDWSNLAAGYSKEIKQGIASRIISSSSCAAPVTEQGPESPSFQAGG